MAESSLSITYNTLRREVGAFLGWGRSHTTFTATQNTDFSDILASGLRMFYFPPTPEGAPRYEWTFLRKTGTITLQTSVSDYTLPDDCGGIVIGDSVVFAEGTNNKTLKMQSEAEVRSFRAMDSQTGVPKYFAVRNELHNTASGQRFEIMVYPTPAVAQNNTVLTLRYISVPGTLNTTNIYPVGGAQYSETVRAAVLAAAEQFNDNDPSGPYYQKFQTMLMQAIRADEESKPQR